MATERSVYKKLGNNVCRRCICKEFGVDLRPEDCIYKNPFPDVCHQCGELRNLVTGFRLSGKRKLLFR
jgi:hypothetical protein